MRRLALLLFCLTGVYGCAAAAAEEANYATPTRVPNATVTRTVASPAATVTPTPEVTATRTATAEPAPIATPNNRVTTDIESPVPGPPPDVVTESVPPRVPVSCLVADGRLPDAVDAVPDWSFRLAAATNVNQLPPFEPLAFHPDEALETSISATIGEASASYAVFIKDMATGRGASFNSERVYYAASLFKLFVMYEVFHQESLGLLSLGDELVMTPYYDSFGLGPRGTSLCQRLTISEALSAMMGVSDNAAAILLQDRVGAPNVSHALASLGLVDSALVEDLPLTATDAGLLLEAIARQAAVSVEASNQMIGLMEGEEFDNGLRAGLSAEAVLAHKTGNWENAVHDAGIVYAPCGTYVIVVLSDNGYDPAVTRQISAVAYDWCAASATH